MELKINGKKTGSKIYRCIHEKRVEKQNNRTQGIR